MTKQICNKLLNIISIKLCLMRLIMLLFFLTGSLLYAQNENVKWSAKPVFSDVKEEFKGENVIGIWQKEKYEYKYNEKGEMVVWHTLHNKFRVNNDEVINQFNKISINLTNVIDVVDIKARAIKSSGEVVPFDKNSIKEITDEDTGDKYKIFTIDGIEKGDEIEYYIVRKMEGFNFGRCMFQYNYPLQFASFELISPKNLIFDAKGYNGFPKGVTKKLDVAHNINYCQQKNIKAIKGEKFSYINPRKKRVEFRLDYNLNNTGAQQLTWDDAAIRVYSGMYLNNDDKVMDKWIELIGMNTGTDMDKIKQVELFIKNNIYVEKFTASQLTDLQFIYDNKVTGTKGIVKLYANIFKKLGIAHELVLTSERDNVKFDPDFQSWNYLDKYLIYFPSLDLYLDPSNIAFRLGTVNSLLTATYGLFIEPVQIGDFESAIGQVRYIKPSSYRQNYDNMNIDISMDMSSNVVRIKNERGMKGLSGGYLANYFAMMNGEQKQNMLRNMNQINAPDPKYNVLEARDSSSVKWLKDAGFIVYADFSTRSFLENAGNKLLLNIGESIGPQSQMYFEDNREAKGENDWNRMYHRVITLHVPRGYKIKNPEVGHLMVTQGKDDNHKYGFESNYTYQGDEYKIDVDEYYKNIYVEDDEFQEFKNVINAAADFNKITLVLEKVN